MDKDISGLWVGKLTYDNSEGVLQNNELHFRMELTMKKGIITGTCSDIKGFGSTPDVATINGFMEENLISFIKKYPNHYEFNEKNELIKIEGKEPVEIQYTGTYHKTNKSITGEWEIIVQAQQYGYGAFEEVVSGKWEMNKKD